MTAQELRESPDAYRALVSACQERGEVDWCQVGSWRGRRYALLGALSLAEGPQEVPVLDVTEPEVALFARVWPERRYPRRWVLVLFHLEGHLSVLTEQGAWKELPESLLPIRMSPGTRVDFRVKLEAEAPRRESEPSFWLLP